MPRARARGAALGEAECAAAAPGSGGEPPPGALRALKRLARGSPAGARAAYAGLMGRLREDDCRVRVHALEAAHALAMRSKLFRDLLARDFCGFLDLTVGSRAGRGLPGPPDAARELRVAAARCVRELAQRYGRFYAAFSMGDWFIARRVRLQPGEFDSERERRLAAEAAEREARAQQALVQEFYAIRFEYPAFMTDARMVACLAEEALDLAQECQGEGQPEGAAGGGPPRGAAALRGFGVASAGEGGAAGRLRALVLEPSLETSIREGLRSVRRRILPQAQNWERKLVQMARPISDGALSRMQMLQELVHLRLRLVACIPALEEALEQSRRASQALEKAPAAAGGALRIPVDGVGDVDFEEVAEEGGTGAGSPAAAAYLPPLREEAGSDDPWHVPGGMHVQGMAAGEREGTPPPGVELAPEPILDPTVRNPAASGRRYGRDRAGRGPRPAPGPKPAQEQPAGTRGTPAPPRQNSRLTPAQREELRAQAPLVAPGPHLQYWGREIPVNGRGMEIEGHWGAWDGNATVAKDHDIARQLTLAPEYYKPAVASSRVCGAPLPDGTFCQRRDTHTCPFHGPIGAGRDPQGASRSGAPSSGAPASATGQGQAAEAAGPAAAAAGASPTPQVAATAREQRALDRAHNRSVLIAASGPEAPVEGLPANEERGSRGARRGKRKLTARQRLSRKLDGARVVAAAAEHLDRLDESRRDSRFSEQW